MICRRRRIGSDGVYVDRRFGSAPTGGVAIEPAAKARLDELAEGSQEEVSPRENSDENDKFSYVCTHARMLNGVRWEFNVRASALAHS